MAVVCDVAWVVVAAVVASVVVSVVVASVVVSAVVASVVDSVVASVVVSVAAVVVSVTVAVVVVWIVGSVSTGFLPKTCPILSMFCRIRRIPTNATIMTPRVMIPPIPGSLGALATFFFFVFLTVSTGEIPDFV